MGFLIYVCNCSKAKQENVVEEKEIRSSCFLNKKLILFMYIHRVTLGQIKVMEENAMFQNYLKDQSSKHGPVQAGINN